MALFEIRDDLVRENTAPEVNDRIDRQIERNIGFMATQPDDVISQRIDELDEEWDLDRLLARNAAVFALTGTVFGAVGNRGWLIIPLAVTSFLWHHMQRGWCPPMPVLRRLGVRTRKEIEVEKCALKLLRGDFAADLDEELDAATRTQLAIAAVTSLEPEALPTRKKSKRKSA